jgi:hypothetical protein
MKLGSFFLRHIPRIGEVYEVPHGRRGGAGGGVEVRRGGGSRPELGPALDQRRRLFPHRVVLHQHQSFRLLQRLTS